MSLEANVPKPIASVQLGVARLGLIIADLPDDVARGAWLRKFHRALAMQDESLDEYAAELLQDVENYREAERNRKNKNNRNTEDSIGFQRKDADSEHSQSVSQKEKKKYTLPEAKASRPRNELFDAIATNFFNGAIAKADASRIGKLAATLKERGATPEQVAEKKAAYARMHSDWDMTPEAVVKHWPQLVEIKQSKKEFIHMTPQEQREWRGRNVI